MFEQYLMTGGERAGTSLKAVINITTNTLNIAYAEILGRC